MGRPTEGAASDNTARARRARLAVALIVLAVLGVLLYWDIRGRYFAATDDAYVAGDLVPIDAQTAGTAAGVFVRRTEFVQ